MNNEQFVLSSSSRLAGSHSHLRRTRCVVESHSTFAVPKLKSKLDLPRSLLVFGQVSGDFLQLGFPCFSMFFFARCCLDKVPSGTPFSQLHKGDGKIARTGHIVQIYKETSKQISGSNKFLASNERDRVQSSARGSIKAAEVHRDDEMRG